MFHIRDTHLYMRNLGMVSLQKYPSHGRTYWRLVESRRVKGKPGIKVLQHLGTADQLLQRLQASGWGGLDLRSFEHGPAAVLWAILERVGVAALIDRHVGTSTRDQSVGTTLALAALHRAIAPGSKRAFSAWADTTSLNRIVSGLDPDRMTSQYFWDQMHRVPEAALEAIEDDLTRRVVKEWGLTVDTLFFDVTNFFSYIDSANARNTLATRGHNKQHRHDLRQWNLALLVSRDGQIPLMSRVYEGNTNDSTAFPDSFTRVRKRVESVVGKLEGVTLVYDRGHHSKPNQARIDGSGFGYVAALTPKHHADLLAIPLTDYVRVKEGRLAGTPAYRVKKELWGIERTLVLHVSETLRQGQVRGLQQHLTKRLKVLQEWKQTLGKPRSGPKTPEAADQKIRALLKGQHVREVLRIEWDAKKQGADRLSWSLDEVARRHLEANVFGKRFLMTNRHDWSDEAIILAYRGQALAEGAFRQLKDVDHGAVRPQYHWTDQKMRVHAFLCLVGLLLVRLLERESRALGIQASSDALLDLLAGIRLAHGVRLSGPEGGRPRVEWKLERASPTAVRLYEALVPVTERSAYTQAGA